MFKCTYDNIVQWEYYQKDDFRGERAVLMSFAVVLFPDTQAERLFFLPPFLIKQQLLFEVRILVDWVFVHQ